MADLYNAIGGIEAHQGLTASHFTRRLVDYSEKDGVFACGDVLDPPVKLRAIVGRKIGQPTETFLTVGLCRGVKQTIGMFIGIEFFEAHEASFKYIG